MVNKNNTDSTHFLQLSILIAQDGFLFYLHHEDSDSAISQNCFEINDILDATSLKTFQKHLKSLCKQYSFEVVKVAFANPYYTFIPKDYYEENAKADYLKYNVQLFEEDQIVSDDIDIIDAVQVYIPLMNYHNAILEEVNEFEYEHFTNTLVKYCKPKIYNGLQQLSVFVRNNNLDIIAFEGQKFKLCNSFKYETEFDLIYYILFCVEELKFHQRQMQLNIYHDQKEMSWVSVLKRYIAKVQVIQKELASLIN